MSAAIFSTALGAVLPIVLLILLGYALQRIDFFGDEFLTVGNKLVFRVCLPVLLFVNVYSIGSLADIRWGICAYCAVAIGVLFLIGLVTAVAVTPRPERRGVLLQCTFRSNFAIIGMSLAAALGGTSGEAVAAILSAVSVPLFNALGVVALSVFRKEEDGRGIRPGKIVKDVLSNPLIIGVLAGVAALLVRQWQVAQFGRVVVSLQRDLPWLFRAAKDVKSITSPLALLILGGKFRFAAVGRLWKEIVTGTLLRTVLAPVLGLGGAVLLSRWGLLQCGVSEYPALIAVFGSPVAVSSAVMAREMGGDEQLATQLLVWTSIVSTLTIFLTVCVMMSAGLLPS